MNLHILGCSGSYPAAGGATAGYLVKEGDTHILMDMGSGVLSALMKVFDPAQLDAIIITHWHYDHACDLLPLQYYLQVVGKKLDIYAPTQPAPLRGLCECPYFKLHDLAEVRSIGAFQVSTCKVEHPMPCYAVKLEAEGRRLVYTGDAMRYEDLIPFAKDADLLLCDGTFTVKQWKPTLPHMSARMAGEFASALQNVRLVVTHIPPCTDAQTLLKEAQQAYRGAVLARPGLRIDI